MHGRSIELFLVNGTADSIVTAELSNWNGKAIKIPRMEVAKCKRRDVQEPGVYFLFCKDEDTDEDSVYIGEAENVKDRLVQHLRDSAAEKEKYYWNNAVIFIGRDLNKALIRYLENRLVEIAKSTNRYKILTKNTYKNTVLKESQIAAMEEFLDNVKVLINALGYKVLESYRQNIMPDNNYDDYVNDLLFNIRNSNAVGRITSDGFVVLKGSKINYKTTNSCPESAKKARLKYKDIIDEDYTLTSDILFSSPSAAASFVGGGSLNGNDSWKDREGKTLKEILQ